MISGLVFPTALPAVAEPICITCVVRNLPRPNMASAQVLPTVIRIDDVGAASTSLVEWHLLDPVWLDRDDPHP